MPDTPVKNSELSHALDTLVKASASFVTRDEWGVLKKDIDTRFQGIDSKFDKLDSKLDAHNDELVQKIEGRKQPVTAFAGLISVAMAIGAAVLLPINWKADANRERIAEVRSRELSDAETRGRNMQRINDLEHDIGGNSMAIGSLHSRGLSDAETRGEFRQKFTTLKEELSGAVVNRKDMHEQVLAMISTLEKELDTVRSAASHEINNGMGQRIEEKTAGMRADIDWLKARIGDR